MSREREPLRTRILYVLPERIALRYLFFGEFPNNVNTVRRETNRGVDGDILAGAVAGVEDDGLLLAEMFEILRLVAERIRGETLSEAQHAQGEVVPGQPGEDFLELHAGPARDVDDEVAQVLPVSAGQYCYYYYHQICRWSAVKGSDIRWNLKRFIV